MDERKQYSVVGQVTIGTDEYRDLIERAMEAEKESADYRNRYWREQEESKKFKEKAEYQEKALEQYRSFVNSTPEISTSYKQFIVEKSYAETNEILQ